MATDVALHEYAALPTTSKRQMDVHTPDPAAYHAPEGRQAAGMRSGMRGVMIPRATRDGGSMGFDAQRAGVVNIIEIDEAGCHHRGTLDMEAVTKEGMEAALAQGDPLLVFQQLSAQQGQQPELVAPSQSHFVAPRVNPLTPGAYVVPRSTPGGQQITEDPMAAGPLPSVPFNPSVKRPGAPVARAPLPVAHEATQLQAAPFVPESQLPAGVPLDQVAALLGLLGRSQALQPAPAPQVAQTAPVAPAAPVGLPADLNLDFLAVEPTKPMRRVAFDLGAGGSISSRYHAVVVHNQLLALIYDTRYEGDHFLPPARQHPGTLGIKLESGESYEVYSQDLLLPVGCLDIVLLLIKATPTVDPTLQAMKEMLDGGPSGE